MHLPERIEIRKATLEDVKDLEALWNEASRPCERYPIYVGQGLGSGQAAVVALADGKVVGFAIGYLIVERGSITEIYVTPEFRNLGIGTVMAQIMDYHLHLMGAKEVCVYANPHTERFWQRLGFTHRESVILTRPCASKTPIA